MNESGTPSSDHLEQYEALTDTVTQANPDVVLTNDDLWDEYSGLKEDLQALMNLSDSPGKHPTQKNPRKLEIHSPAEMYWAVIDGDHETLTHLRLLDSEFFRQPDSESTNTSNSSDNRSGILRTLRMPIPNPAGYWDKTAGLRTPSFNDLIFPP